MALPQQIREAAQDLLEAHRIRKAWQRRIPHRERERCAHLHGGERGDAPTFRR